MRVILQRVQHASVMVDGEITGKIESGILTLVGFEPDDTKEDFEWISKKIIQLRIFNDENDVMNLDVQQTNGDILVVSQFTLHASTKKGNRPSFIEAAKPDIAIPLYESMIVQLEKELGKSIQTGEFGADMKVALINDGPVTIVIDSKNKQ